MPPKKNNKKYNKNESKQENIPQNINPDNKLDEDIPRNPQVYEPSTSKNKKDRQKLSGIYKNLKQNEPVAIIIDNERKDDDNSGIIYVEDIIAANKIMQRKCNEYQEIINKLKNSITELEHNNLKLTLDKLCDDFIFKEMFKKKKELYGDLYIETEKQYMRNAIHKFKENIKQSLVQYKNGTLPLNKNNGDDDDDDEEEEEKNNAYSFEL